MKGMLPWMMLASGVFMLLRPKLTAAQSLPATTAPELLPVKMTESECISRSGIWVGGECLGAKTVEQVQAEAMAKRERLLAQQQREAAYQEERFRMIADSTARMPSNATDYQRRVISERP